MVPPNRRVTTELRGVHLLNEPALNKGTAFTLEERARFGIEGHLPTAVETMDQQLARCHRRYSEIEDDLGKHVYLRALRDQNEVLFYAYLRTHLADVLPIIYTPTVGAACQQFSHIYQRPHGVFISVRERARMMNQFDSIEGPVDVIVVTDGERILGLGDQGIGGMGIPIGKLALYSAIGGVDPRRTLPVVLDCGTNNPELLADPLYMGCRERRIVGDDYADFVDEFVQTVRTRFPGVLLQWEDFAQANAAPLLARYRDTLLSFNDDIQGTAAVALAAIESAAAAAGGQLADQRFCIVGAGSAGTGIAAMIRGALERAGVEDAASHLFLTDRYGLLHDQRTDLTPYQQPFAQPWESVEYWAKDGASGDLEAVVVGSQATVLIGVSGQPDLFTEPMVRGIAARVPRPIIMPLSNPTSRAEAKPADLLEWTDGRALVATGSPFGVVEYDDRLVVISQANNAYVFPGVGVGAVIAQATRVTDAMMVAAAGAVAADSTADDFDADPGLLPPVTESPMVARRVALAVARAAIDEGVAPDATDAELAERLDAYQWLPTYPELEAP